jgi:hypothetical protein
VALANGKVGAAARTLFKYFSQADLADWQAQLAGGAWAHEGSEDAFWCRAALTLSATGGAGEEETLIELGDYALLVETLDRHRAWTDFHHGQNPRPTASAAGGSAALRGARRCGPPGRRRGAATRGVI